jgi:carboxylesterase type B
MTSLTGDISGGYVEGGSADRRYNLSFIVQNSAEAGIPIIGVSINYRLAGKTPKTVSNEPG